MRYHYTSIRIAEIKNNNKCCQGSGETRTLTYCWWECKNKQIKKNTSENWVMLTNLNISLPCDPVNFTPQRNKNIFPITTYMNIHSGFIHNSKKLEKI